MACGIIKSKLQSSVFRYRYGHKPDCVIEAFETVADAGQDGTSAM